MAELMPCPFCGAGETRIDTRGHWTGRRMELISARVRHWCRRPEGYLQSVIEMAGKTEAEAIAAWNTRAKQEAQG